MRLALAAAALVMTAAGQAAAQTQPFEARGPEVRGWAVDLGVGALYGVDSDGDTGSETRVVPYVSASWNDVAYVSPFEGLGWNVIKTDDFRAGVQLRPRFDADEVEGLTLDRPDFGADAAIYAFKRIPGNVVVGGRIMSDDLDTHATETLDRAEEYLSSVDELVLRAIVREPSLEAYRRFVDAVASRA